MAARQGKRLAREGQMMTEKMEQGVYTGVTNDEGVQGGAKAIQFSRKFDARSRYDDEMNTKMQLMDKDGMTPFGQVYYDDKVGRWLQDKEAAVESANFDAYFGANMVKNDLASRQWAQEIHPEWFDSREEEMDERAEWVLKIKKIQLRGPQTEEELRILYLIETGKVQLPEDWDKIGPGYDGSDPSAEQKRANVTNLRKGLIRMPMFLTEKQMQSRAGDNKSAGAWGDKDYKPEFYHGEPPSVRTRNNQPLSKFSNGRTINMNYKNFLSGRQ